MESLTRTMRSDAHRQRALRDYSDRPAIMPPPPSAAAGQAAEVVSIAPALGALMLSLGVDRSWATR